MTNPVLYIGNKVYSSWSMRPWLVLTRAGIGFDERMVHLYDDQAAARLQALSPAATVPVLVVDGVAIWDSLAICEWAAEQVTGLWPADPVARAQARSVVATMHAGFPAMRRVFTHNIRRRMPLRQDAPDDALRDVAQMSAILSHVLSRWGGEPGFLFGQWSIADAFYTPVAVRARAYVWTLPPVVQAYFDTLLAQPEFLAWQDDALAESFLHPPYEEV